VVSSSRHAIPKTATTNSLAAQPPAPPHELDPSPAAACTAAVGPSQTSWPPGPPPRAAPRLAAAGAVLEAVGPAVVVPALLAVFRCRWLDGCS